MAVQAPYGRMMAQREIPVPNWPQAAYWRAFDIWLRTGLTGQCGESAQEGTPNEFERLIEEIYEKH